MPRRKKAQKAQESQGPVVRLRHTVRKGDWQMYFYEGSLPVRDSIIEVPASRPEWVRRAWIQGFRMTVAGRVIANLEAHVRAETSGEPEAPEKTEGCCPDECCQPETEELSAVCCQDKGCCADNEGADCACTPVVETETAESGEETTDEGPADGGQSPADDGVRSSEPDGDGSLPEGGDDGRVGDEPADGGDGDQPAD